MINAVAELHIPTRVVSLHNIYQSVSFACVMNVGRYRVTEIARVEKGLDLLKERGENK
jgi:hypothetical protein